MSPDAPAPAPQLISPPVFIAAQPAAPALPLRLVLPERIPADCVRQTSQDFGVAIPVLLAVLKVESGGRTGIVRSNSNGSFDVGPMQLNSKSWLPYFQARYGVTPQELDTSMCSSLRAGAYVLRTEAQSGPCRALAQHHPKGQDVWCAVGRYHAPNSVSLQAGYISRVVGHALRMMASGRFE